MIALGCDHGGYELKEAIKQMLSEKRIEYKDYGTYNKKKVDYPEFALMVAESVKNGESQSGILCCGTGIGVSIAANKVPGIRAAAVSDVFTARATKQHNNSNILCLGGRVIGVGLALLIVEEWLNAEFQGGRHQDRINMISKIEEKYTGNN
ncbi:MULTISPECIES: ribose 5-phosphate isomerase B [Clostridium]|uniref:ribose 5-phosphate isomerase B n=1 Tax=Clostridium TaxID=1485 RepID=UPI00069FF91E|nr:MULTISPECIES: ribose 5-phosphate isomerase B [Clostridium]KOF58074.1 ribose 5-phosphate isomerase [Clostridium sp. DMHC 10]MCD2346918.1 ribose 5-phosphate isomerase B [Clostridium guangxiense]